MDDSLLILRQIAILSTSSNDNVGMGVMDAQLGGLKKR